MTETATTHSGSVRTAIDARADELIALAPSNEALGRLDDRAAAVLRESGMMRMLQPATHGGSRRTRASSPRR
ncbi:hypothetical protein [Nocardioides sambongensis]|uniref:hypothetical protein n=1 Tax=Nocardioides sambongensis TaxID=2589074 RepID=UPI001E2D9621|nr:hypothetical protein [Nocardioides sambongensis]